MKKKKEKRKAKTITSYTKQRVTNTDFLFSLSLLSHHFHFSQPFLRFFSNALFSSIGLYRFPSITYTSIPSILVTVCVFLVFFLRTKKERKKKHFWVYWFYAFFCNLSYFRFAIEKKTF